MTIFVYLTINCDTGQHSQFLRCFLTETAAIYNRAELGCGGSKSVDSPPILYLERDTSAMSALRYREILALLKHQITFEMCAKYSARNPDWAE